MLHDHCISILFSFVSKKGVSEDIAKLRMRQTSIGSVAVVGAAGLNCFSWPRPLSRGGPSRSEAERSLRSVLENDVGD